MKTNSYFNEQSHIDILWEMGYSGKKVKIGLVDTGIKTSEYPGIKKNIVCGHNFSLDGSGRDNIYSECYHGAQVASLILSVAPKAKLVVAKVLNDKGEGDSKKTAAGIRYCISKKCNIINCSIASAHDPELEEAIDEARKNNIIVVSATGNDGQYKLHYPGSYINCLSIGSINKNFEISSFSNYHPLMDAVSIGEDIEFETKGGKIIDSGTSFSVAFVTGTLALLYEKLKQENNKKPKWYNLYSEFMNNCTLIEGIEVLKQGKGFFNAKEVNNR